VDARDAFFGEPSPYPGLRPYEADEERFFYGRDQQVEEIAGRLGEKHVVAVLGGSGCGKSSIVRAGLVPYLRRKGIPGRYDFWCTAVFTPQERPLDRLAAALARLLSPPLPPGAQPPPTQIAEVKDSLESSAGLGGFLETFRKRLFIPEGLTEEIRRRANVLVVFDQFEELFREANRRRREAEDFARLLVDTWREKSEGTYALLTMRTEDLHHCATFLELPDLLNEAGYLARRLDEAEIGEAIVRPAQRLFLEQGVYETAPRGREAALPFAPEVVQRLQEAAQAFAWNPDHLPLLQHLLSVLWRTASDRWASGGLTWQSTSGGGHGTAWRISLEDLRAAVGCGAEGELPTGEALLGSAVETTAEAMLARLPPGAAAPYTSPDELRGTQKAAAFALTLLASQGEQTTYTRRWTTRGEIRAVSGASDEDVEAALGAFVSPYPLLRDEGRETRDPEAKIDVAHESFIRNWPRFRDWLKRDRWARETYLTVADRWKDWERYRAGRPRAASWPAWWLGDYRLTRKQITRADRLLDGRLNAAWAARYDNAYQQARAEVGNDGAGLSSARAAQEARFAAQRSYVRASARSSRVGNAALGMLALGLVGGLAYISAVRQESAELQRKSDELVQVNRMVERLAAENERLAELSAITSLATLAAAMAFQNGDPAVLTSENGKFAALRELAMAFFIADLMDRISETVPRPEAQSAARLARFEMTQRIARRFADTGVRRGLEVLDQTWDLLPSSLQRESAKLAQAQLNARANRSAIVERDGRHVFRAQDEEIENIFAASSEEFPVRRYDLFLDDRGETTLAYLINDKKQQQMAAIYMVKVERERDPDFDSVARTPIMVLELSAAGSPLVDLAIGDGPFEGSLLVQRDDGSIHAVPWRPEGMLAPLCGFSGAPLDQEGGTAVRQLIVTFLQDDTLATALRKAAQAAGPRALDELERLLADPFTAACPKPPPAGSTASSPRVPAPSAPPRP
jgi:hypothetical protein